MADMIAKQNRLLALMPEIVFRDGKAHVEMRLTRGLQSMVERTFPLSALDDRAAVRPRPLEDEAGQVLEAIDYFRGETEPVWLHLPRDAPELARYPWETALGRWTPAPLLRIPNFLLDPFDFDGRLRCVILASAPAAKSKAFHRLVPVVRDMVGAIRSAIPEGARCEMHVFTDREAYHELNYGEWPDNAGVTLHHPGERSDHEAPERSRRVSSSMELTNPWLRWIARTLRGAPIDILHAACPGYSDGRKSALALARSPVNNDDPSWARFVGAAELCTLLDTLGVGALGLHPLQDDIWAPGLRQLAWEMAWLRPGPVLSIRDCEPEEIGDIAAFHRLLTRHPEASLDGLKQSILNIHPSYLVHLPTDAEDEEEFTFGLRPQSDDQPILKAVRGTEALIESVEFDQFVEDLRPAILSNETLLGLSGAVEPAQRAKDLVFLATEQAELRGRASDRKTGYVPPDFPEAPEWKALAERRLGIRRAQITSVEPLTDRDILARAGAAEALDFVSGLLREVDATGSTVADVSAPPGLDAGEGDDR